MFPLTLLFVGTALAECFDPSPAFPLPKFHPSDPLLEITFGHIEDALRHEYDKTQQGVSFSVEVTSSERTLWSTHYTANETKDGTERSQHRGVTIVDENSLYRIASITKVFTVLGILYQYKAGNLSLDDPVLHYLPQLNSSAKLNLPWKDITIRTLASQLSGIPRDVLGEDAFNVPGAAEELGLPPIESPDLPKCGEFVAYSRPCGTEDFYAALQDKEAMFPPNQKSTYSNDAFDLLGMVLEKVTGMSYTAYMQSSIFDPLGMNHTHLDRPSSSSGVIPSTPNYWDVEEGVQRPTGGIYSCTSDLSIFLRFVLTHYNGLTSGALNWLHPASYSEGLHSFYGMPWEIFRTDKLLPSTTRPVTFITKGGYVDGYRSEIILSPEHDLAITLLVASSGPFITRARDIITTRLIRAADKIALAQLEHRYAGVYATAGPATLNSSVVLRAHGHSGLVISRFVSNGTDVLAALHRPDGLFVTAGAARLQLTPTLLFEERGGRMGERWRFVLVWDRAEALAGGVWGDSCFTAEDMGMYAGRAINEIVFWEGEGADVEAIELSGWRVELRKEEEDVERGKRVGWGPVEGGGQLLLGAVEDL